MVMHSARLTMHYLQSFFWWFSLGRDVGRWNGPTCDVCQRTHPVNAPVHTARPEPDPVFPEWHWDKLHVDGRVVLVWVERSTYFVELQVLPPGVQGSAQDVAASFLERCLPLAGIPEAVISDQDCANAAVWLEVCDQLCIARPQLPVRAHASVVEMTNHRIRAYLRKMKVAGYSDWMSRLGVMRYAFQSTPLPGMYGATPMEAMTGRVPVDPPVSPAYLHAARTVAREVSHDAMVDMNARRGGRLRPFVAGVLVKVPAVTWFGRFPDKMDALWVVCKVVSADDVVGSVTVECVQSPKTKKSVLTSVCVPYLVNDDGDVLDAPAPTPCNANSNVNDNIIEDVNGHAQDDDGVRAHPAPVVLARPPPCKRRKDGRCVKSDMVVSRRKGCLGCKRCHLEHPGRCSESDHSPRPRVGEMLSLTPVEVKKLTDVGLYVCTLCSVAIGAKPKHVAEHQLGKKHQDKLCKKEAVDHMVYGDADDVMNVAGASGVFVKPPCACWDCGQLHWRYGSLATQCPAEAIPPPSGNGDGNEDGAEREPRVKATQAEDVQGDALATTQSVAGLRSCLSRRESHVCKPNRNKVKWSATMWVGSPGLCHEQPVRHPRSPRQPLVTEWYVEKRSFPSWDDDVKEVLCALAIRQWLCRLCRVTMMCLKRGSPLSGCPQFDCPSMSTRRCLRVPRL
jgi:hypothetical protein